MYIKSVIVAEKLVEEGKIDIRLTELASSKNDDRLRKWSSLSC